MVPLAAWREFISMSSVIRRHAYVTGQFIWHWRAPGTALMPHKLPSYRALHIYTHPFTTFKVFWDFHIVPLHFI